MRPFSPPFGGPHTLIVLGCMLLLAPESKAFVISVGANCQLTREVNIDIKTGEGRMKVPLARGAKLTIVAVTALSSRVQSANFEGTIDNGALEDACSYAAETCALKNAVKVNERMDGEGKAWRIKPGGKLEILARGSPWSTVRIGPVEGFIETAALGEQCPAPDNEQGSDDLGIAAKDEGVNDDDTGDGFDGEEAEEAATPLILRRPVKGTRVMLLPFLLDGRRDDALAVLYEDALTAAMTKKRSDTMGPAGKRPNARSRSLAAKQVLVDLVPAARDAGLTHLIVVEMSRGGATREPERRTVRFDDEDDGYAEQPDLLVVTVFDLAARKVTKRLKVTPSLEFKDPWADRTLEAIEPMLPPVSASASRSAKSPKK